MHPLAVSSVRGAVLRRTLRAGSAASPTGPHVRIPLPAPVNAVSASARKSQCNGAHAATFSTASESRANALSRSLLGDIQALQHVHAQLSIPGSLLSERFRVTMERLERCRSENRCIFVTGIGKSGIVGRRLAATLASISVRSQWIHGSEWTHGDVGNLQPGDVVIILSHSGNTAELQSLPSLVTSRDAEPIAIVGQDTCALAEACSRTLVVPVNDPPHCPVPSRSIVVQEAICNAIVEHLLDSVGDCPDAFRDNHPGGAIGNGFFKP